MYTAQCYAQNGNIWLTMGLDIFLLTDGATLFSRWDYVLPHAVLLIARRCILRGPLL